MAPSAVGEDARADSSLSTTDEASGAFRGREPPPAGRRLRAPPSTRSPPPGACRSKPALVRAAPRRERSKASPSLSDDDSGTGFAAPRARLRQPPRRNPRVPRTRAAGAAQGGGRPSAKRPRTGPEALGAEDGLSLAAGAADAGVDVLRRADVEPGVGRVLRRRLAVLDVLQEQHGLVAHLEGPLADLAF